MEARHAKSKNVFIALTAPTKTFDLEMEAELRRDREQHRIAEESKQRKEMHEASRRNEKHTTRSQSPLNEDEKRVLEFSKKRIISNRNNEIIYRNNEETMEITNRLSYMSQ